MCRRHPSAKRTYTLFPDTTLFRSRLPARQAHGREVWRRPTERSHRPCYGEAWPGRLGRHCEGVLREPDGCRRESRRVRRRTDRKSTRLNSSLMRISYAVFCLTKNNKTSTQLQHAVTSDKANV